MYRNFTSRTRVFYLLLLGLASCSPSSESGTSATDPSDGRCELVVIATDRVGLNRCTDGSAYALRWSDGPEIDHVGLRLELDGEFFGPKDWPVATWSTQGQTARLLLSSHPKLPEVALTVTLDDPLVSLTMTLTSDQPLTVSAFEPLWAGGERGGLKLAGTGLTEWLSFGDLGDPITSSQAVGPRQNEQVFFDAESALYAQVNAANSTIGVHTDSAPNRIGVAIEHPDAVRLGPGRPYVVQLSLRAGPSLGVVLDASVRADLEPNHRRPSPRSGWRSGAAYGYFIHQDILQSVTAWFGRHSATPVLMIDGLWYERIGLWAPGVAFTDGFPVGDTHTLGLRWPALLAPTQDPPPADEVVSENCQEGPCTLINLGRPETREALASAAVDLASAGVEFVEIPDVPSRWVSAVLETVSASGLTPILATSLHALDMFTLKVQAGTPNAEGPCSTAYSADDERCRDDLSTPSSTQAFRTPNVTDLIRQAWALSTRWHHGLRLALDPGPIHVAGQPPGIARQWATLGSMGGGLYLLGDNVEAIDAQATTTFWAPWDAGLIQLGRPLYAGAELPSVWKTDRSVALFNWTDETKLATNVADYLPSNSTVRSLFDGRLLTEGIPDQVEIPPNDVVVLFVEE